MRALDRKLLRDLWQLRGQSSAIAMVVAVGVAMFCMYFSTFESLAQSRASYYERYRLADVFASLVRAPLSLAERIAEIPGVSSIETRTVRHVNLDLEGLAEPALGRLVSIPEERRAMLNDVFLVQGRYPQAAAPDEVLLSRPFAEA
ncbi:MAG: ABC transporter permease, partial [Thermoanaerobaculia bacterium]|nr:ABC transporter permease [Thermoanaerobaculia bacterium]